MNNYVAWLSYENNEEHEQSVYRGTLKECKNQARKIHESDNWKAWANNRKTHVKITRGAKQFFVTSYILQ